MRSNRLIWSGAITAALGWLMLFYGSSLPIDEIRVSGMRINAIINTHLLSISQNVIYLGYFMVLIGSINALKSLVASGQQLEDAPNLVPAVAVEPIPLLSPSSARPELDTLERRIQAAKERAGLNGN